MRFRKKKKKKKKRKEEELPLQEPVIGPQFPFESDLVQVLEIEP